jgi:hypothetical protein
MRQRLRNFLPVLLVALAIQVLAPIVATFAIAGAVSDWAWSDKICHHGSEASSPNGDDSGHGCDDGCPLCCVAAQGDGWLNVPQLTAISAPQAVCTSVDWSGQMPGGIASLLDTSRQARAPPQTT